MKDIRGIDLSSNNQPFKSFPFNVVVYGRIVCKIERYWPLPKVALFIPLYFCLNEFLKLTNVTSISSVKNEAIKLNVI